MKDVNKMKRYGNEKTNLVLSPIAEKEYSGSDYTIYENGIIYEVWLDNHAILKNLTADEVNEFFESFEEGMED